MKVGGSTPSPCHRVFSLAISLSTQAYKMVTSDTLLGVTLQWTSIPSREGAVGILEVASCYRNREKLRPCWPVWLVSNFTFLPYGQTCSPICSKILDFAFTNFQLKLKEVMHTSLEKPQLSQKADHINLTLTLWYLCILISSRIIFVAIN